MNYEEHMDLNFKTAEWILAQSTKLINEYKTCHTETRKKSIEKKLRAIQGKLQYEKRVMENITGEANNEGFEF